MEPPVGAESGPFWEATRKGTLLVQWCTSCDRGIFYPRFFCPYCAADGRTTRRRTSRAGRAGGGGSTLEWRTASGRAIVHAATVEHNPAATGATFSHGEPYVVALVDLDEGVRMMTNIVGCAPEDVRPRHGGDGDLGAALRRSATATLHTGGEAGVKDRAAAAAEGMLLAWWAAKGPDRPAVITAYGNRTFGELNANINRLVRALRARGLAPGDSVALMCTNRPEFLEVLYAAQRSGLRLTPINWHLTGEEAAYIVANCEAKAFIGAAELGDKIAEASRGGTSAAASGPGRGRGSGGDGPSGRRRRPAGVCVIRRGDRRRRRGGHRRPGHRHPDALHVGHHGSPQGRAPRGPGAQRAGHRQLLRLRRGLGAQRRRPSVHRAALPRRPAGLLDRHPVHLRRARRDHGALGSGRDAAAHRAARDHPHPHGADHVPPHAGPARRRAAGVGPVVAALHHPRRGALSRSASNRR